MVRRHMQEQPLNSKPSLTLRPLARGDLPIGTLALAKFLIGKVLVREDAGELLTGRIV